MVNKEKTLLLKTSLPYLEILISGKRVKPIIRHNLFDLLLLKKHRNLLSLQQTVGALNWFRKFIPNYSQLVCPIYTALKAIGLYDLEESNEELDHICRPIISKVQEYLHKEMPLSHPDYKVEKYIYLYIAEVAFACAFWQKLSSGKKEFVEF